MARVDTAKSDRKLREPEILTNDAGKILAFRFDVADLLRREIGADWQNSFRDFMTFKSEHLVRSDEHNSVREKTGAEIELMFVNGHSTFGYFSGLEKLYRGAFKKLMTRSLLPGAEPLTIADESIMAAEAYEQTEKANDSRIEQRMEAHVDSRYTAVLVIDMPKKGYGGRLVVGNNPKAASLEEIEKDATYIEHRPGTLVCFSSGRELPHFTEETLAGGGRRIVVGFKFPLMNETFVPVRKMTPYLSESLSRHALGGRAANMA